MEQFDVLELLETVQVFENKLNLALMYSGLRLPQFRAMVFMEKATPHWVMVFPEPHPF